MRFSLHQLYLCQSYVWASAALLVIGAAGALGIAALAATPNEKVISMSAMKFEFLPPTINLKRGEPVILELSSLDRTHGFKVPDLSLDVAVLSDTTVRVRVVPEKAGRFVFLCDNFCGDGHEDMNGVIVVSE
jgi:cytochrome c oxidase subunit 2